MGGAEPGAAQLRPGWGRLLQREVAAEAEAAAADEEGAD